MDYDVLDRNGSVILSVGRERTPGICDETCRGCAYRGTAGGVPCCDHFTVTGRRRGCPAGKGCTARVAGKRAKGVDELAFRVPPNAAKPEIRKPEAQKPKALPAPAPEPDKKPERRTDLKALTEEERLAHRREVERAWYAKNKEKINAKVRQRRLAEPPEKKQKRKEAHQAWYARHREDRNAYMREYRRRKKEGPDE